MKVLKTRPERPISIVTGRTTLLLSCILFWGISSVYGQDGTRNRGFYPGASYAVSNIETINTKNGNLMLSIPLASLPPSRGGLTAGIGLFYDSKIFDTFTYFDGRYPEGPYTTELKASEDGGWRYGFKYEFELVNRFDNYHPQYCIVGDPAETYVWKLRMKFPDGSVHVFRPQGANDGQGDDFFRARPDGWLNTACQGDAPFWYGPITYYSADGTFLRLDVQHDSDNDPTNNPWTLFLSDGGRVTGGGTAFQRIYDRNNNYIEIQNITYNSHPATKIVDQMNRYIVLENDLTGDDYVHAWRNDEDGQLTELVWTIKRGYSGGNKGYYANPSDVWMGSFFYSPGVESVTEIDLPAQSGGLSYQFGYDNAYWGEVSSVTLPSGVKASYQYSLGEGAPYSDTEAKTVLLNYPLRKDLVYRLEDDLSGGVSNTPCNPATETCTTETWTFSYDGVCCVPGGISIAQTTGPDNGVTKDYSFGSIPGADGNPPFNPVFKSERPDGTMVETLWRTNYPFGSNLNRAGINPYAKTVFTTLKNAQGQYDITSIKDYNYDKNGNVTHIAEYDWVNYNTVPHDGYGVVTGIPAGATVKRVTTNSYYNSTPDASDYLTNNTNEYSNALSPQVRMAIQSSEVADGASSVFSRSEFFYDNASTTANPIQQTSWDSTKGGYSNPLSSANSISASSQFDAYGNPILKTDARGFQTQFTYSNVGGFTDLYPTQIKSAYQTAIQRTETREYDFYSGLATRATDADNNVSTLTVYDVFGRPTLVKAAEGKPEETRTASEYSDVNRRVIVRSDLNTVGDGKLVSIQHYDQLGRVRLARQLEDSTTQSATDETQGIKVQTRYTFSGLNSYALTSNPYRAAYSSSAGSESTMGWTRSTSDNGGRIVEVQTFGGAGLPAPWGTNSTSTGTVITAYDAEFTTVTDQAGKVRRSMTDGLGRLARVDEPDLNGNLGATSAPAQPTSYTYDALSNLINVDQGSQARSFSYSSLGRLTSATNPESGTVSYSYDNSGNLLTKTDARSIVSTYVYDALNRVTNRTYSDSTPAVTYNYDPNIANGKGRLAAVSSIVSTYTYSSYDSLGRVLAGSQALGAQSYPLAYSYDLAGHVTSMTYPSLRVVNYNYDNAGRLADKDATHLAFTGNLGDGTQRTYASGISYSPLGGIAREQYGTTTPLYHKTFYNSRGQMFDTRVSSVNDTWDWNRGRLIWYYSTNHVWGGSGTDNNGNLIYAENWVPPPNQNGDQAQYLIQDSYTYDALNRLSAVNESSLDIAGGGSWTAQFAQAYSYDRYGNRTINAGETWGTGINNKQFTVDTANNRLGVPSGQTGTMSYDNAGNLTTDTYSAAAVTRVYDAENRMTKETQAGSYDAGIYGYDGDGRRVKRNVGGVETWQVYGLGGELVAEYAANTASSNPQKEYGYRNGQLLITATVTTGWGSAPTLHDNPLVVSETTVQARHITELRDAINALRSHLNMSAYSWQYSATTSDYIGANPIIEMRTALDQALGAPSGGYAAGLAQNQPVKAVHIQELRDRVLAAWVSSGSTDVRWLVADQLGTPRMIFDQIGSLANISRHDYLPFGEELSSVGGLRSSSQGYTNNDGARQKFTQKERDSETGLDYFGARYYASTQGRFTSVDPSRKSIIGANPQSWNRYMYALNNPLAYVDRNGKWPTPIHNLIIDRALQGLSDAQRQKIKDGSWSVDDPLKGGQNTSRANEHGQTIPGQSQDDAAQQADQFINTNVDNAKELNERGDFMMSLCFFGKAFHTVSDMTSPAHEGYQVWQKRGAFLHADTEKAISSFRMGLAVGATIALYRYTYGQEASKRAVNYAPGSINDPSVMAIRREFSMPGSDPRAESEALYEYRLGLQEGLNFDWGRQGGRRSRRQSERPIAN